MVEGNSKFTVFIRLPFSRGDFVDPPAVDWNAAKDQALWDILSRPSRGDDIDWKALADGLGVTPQFLLQQAAWLYDRQLTQVRAQMRKVGTAQSTSPSPMLGSTSGSTALDKQAGRGVLPAGTRLPSRLATQQQQQQPQKDPSLRNTPRRTSSTTTVNQVKAQHEPSRNVTPTAESKDQGQGQGPGRRPSLSRREQQQPPTAPVRRSPTLEEEELSSPSSESESDDEDDEDELNSRRNPRFKRFGKFSMHRPTLRDDEDDDDEDDSPAFLPLASPPGESDSNNQDQDPNATLRLDADSPQPQHHHHKQKPQPSSRNPVTTESSTSSASSGVPVNLPRRPSHYTGPQSPRRTAALAHSSPRRSVGSGREASDGTPSMGSSFSDLEDTSVTQSALEDAYLSNMQHGGMASRVSAMSQALRSRYLPGNHP